MRLFLSSYRFGRHAEALSRLVGSRRTALVIGNALDYLPAAARTIYTAASYDPVSELTEMGLPAGRLDLRDFIGEPLRLHDELTSCGLVWVLGGNAFVLRRAMRVSGFDSAIHALLAQDSLVYGGFSAGAVVAAPSLRGLDLMDDPTVGLSVPHDVSYEGLHLFPKMILPHVSSSHRETFAADRVAHWLTENDVPFVALQDGQAIQVDGDKTELLA